MYTGKKEKGLPLANRGNRQNEIVCVEKDASTRNPRYPVPATLSEGHTHSETAIRLPRPPRPKKSKEEMESLYIKCQYQVLASSYVVWTFGRNSTRRG